MLRLQGIFPPLTTPFENEKISIPRFQKNLEMLSGFDLTGYVLLGSNGEAPLLHELEKVQLIKSARMITPDDKTLIAGAGMETINATVRMSKIAAEYGADALLIITPFYYKGQMDGDALYDYYMSVADKVKLPVLLYNVPKITGLSLPVETAVKLSDHDKIIGIKDSSGDLLYLMKLRNALPDDFIIFSGNASTFAPALAAGAAGGILGIINGMPEPFARIYQAHQKDDKAEAMKIQKQVLEIIGKTIGTRGVPGVKALMDIRGFYGGPPRTPLKQLDNDVFDEIKEELKLLEKAGIIEHISLL
jgi:4-hydroxy-2-oxoglutarate aldolase